MTPVQLLMSQDHLQSRGADKRLGTHRNTAIRHASSALPTVCHAQVTLCCLSPVGYAHPAHAHYFPDPP
jgi:hypothetical protein